MANPPLAQRTVCMSELSKDVKGELRPAEEILQRCSDRKCVTLATVHELVMDASSFRCDSKLGSLLDGQITAKVISKFIDGNGERRGVHEGQFRWAGNGGLVTGTMQGVTNLGTHREPVFGDCQHCDDRGVMEGQLIGTITRAIDKSLRGCEVRAAYRLRFDQTKGGGMGALVGVIEGAIVCDCGRVVTEPVRTCIEFARMPIGSGPNPRVEQGVTFTVHNHAGTPHPSTEIDTWGTSITGMNVGHSTRIQLPAACSAVEATLARFAGSASFEAFDGSGASVGVLGMTVGQGTPETLRLVGADIVSAVITAPSNETLLTRFCFETP